MILFKRLCSVFTHAKIIRFHFIPSLSYLDRVLIFDILSQPQNTFFSENGEYLVWYNGPVALIFTCFTWLVLDFDAGLT